MGNNWDGDGGYPDDPNDVVIFDAITSKQSITMGNVMGAVDLTIAKIETKNDYAGEIKLHKSLTIKHNAQAGISVLDSPVKIAPQNLTSNLLIDAAQVTVHHGQLGSSTNRTTLSVINGGVLDFRLKAGAWLGMDLVLGTAGGGAGKGRMLLADDGNPGPDGYHLTLRNAAGITVNKDSDLTLRGADGDG